MSTRCQAKNPATCRNHGGRLNDEGKPAPLPWAGVDSRPKKARGGKKEYKTRQIHGFQNEFRVCEMHNLQKTDNYTFRWDAFTKGRKPVPVSIKTKSAGGDIEMGDLFRQASHKEDFYLHVSFWKDKKRNVIQEHILLIPGDYWQSLFKHEMRDDIKKVLADASNDRDYDAKWTEDITALREKWGTDGPIRLRPKRDHKKQLRMQCAINHKQFLKMVELFSVDDFTAHRKRR